MIFIKYSGAYRRSFKRISKSGKFPRIELESVIKKIQRREILDTKYHDHKLSEEFADHRECHIKSNLLLIYRIENKNLVLVLVNLGSHSDLFD